MILAEPTACALHAAEASDCHILSRHPIVTLLGGGLWELLRCMSSIFKHTLYVMAGLILVIESSVMKAMRTFL